MSGISIFVFGLFIGGIAGWMLRDLFTKIKNDGNTRRNDLIDLDSLLSPGEAFGQKQTHQRHWDEVCERWKQKEKEGMI